MGIQKLPKRLKRVKRNFASDRIKNWARDWRQVGYKYGIDGFNPNPHTLSTARFKNLTSMEGFVKVLYAMHPKVAEIYLITGDLCSTIAICNCLKDDVHEMMNADEITKTLISLQEYFVNGEWGSLSKAFITARVKSILNNPEYIYNGESFQERFDQVREQWFWDYQEATQRMIKKIELETDPKKIMKLLELLSSEISAQIEMMDKLKSSSAE